jgi:hypothetical protein
MFYINPDFISDEKYSLEKFMPYEIDNYDVLNSYFLEHIKDIPVSGSFTILSEEFRPDLISYRIFGTVNYWSLIMFYNDILSIEDLTTGTVINYFSARDLEKLYYNLKSKESQ